VFLVACASTDRNADRNYPSANTASGSVAEYVVTENYDLDLIEYTVKPGDRLSDIAREVTGVSSNWREIAEFNAIDDPRRLQSGTILAIPTELIVGYEGTTTVLIGPSEPTGSTAQAQSSSLAMRHNDAVEAPVVVTPIYTNRDFELNPIDPNAPKPTQSYQGEGTQIRVIGTYYPKAVYLEPAAYSKLILRAAPGTLFILDSQVNDWYKIETAAGSGYIRTSDAAIIEKKE